MEMNSDSDIETIVSTVFGYQPKQQQIAAIESFTNGIDTVFVAPTGFGKSLLYQIAPFIYDKDTYNIQLQSATTMVSVRNAGDSDCAAPTPRSPTSAFDALLGMDLQPPCASTPNHPTKNKDVAVPLPGSIAAWDSTVEDISVCLENVTLQLDMVSL